MGLVKIFPWAGPSPTEPSKMKPGPGAASPPISPPPPELHRPGGLHTMAPPELVDDLSADIFLRLPPDDPEHLVRASLVCKTWRRVISDPDFLMEMEDSSLGFVYIRDSSLYMWFRKVKSSKELLNGCNAGSWSWEKLYLLLVPSTKHSWLFLLVFHFC